MNRPQEGRAAGHGDGGKQGQGGGVGTNGQHDGRALVAGNTSHRIIPGEPPRNSADRENLQAWGFQDSAFSILPNGNVQLTGTRYGLSGTELPDLLPWTRGILAADLRPDDTHPSRYPPSLPAPRLDVAFDARLRTILPADAIVTDDAIRLRHGHGHTIAEVYAIHYGQLPRVPDVVVYPSTDEQVAALVEAAVQADVCLVPYGGGTNVSEALRCPPDEDRLIVSIDMSRMRRILWIDPVNHMACIQAGAVGRDIQSQLAEHGFTLGHEPDSVELSTLGGWIATNASGMKKNRYGNIEDLVLDVQVASPRGGIARTEFAPRESAGIDLRRAVFGSEGTLGIITSAVVKIFPLPEVQRYDSLLFPSFEDGVAFLYDLTREGVPPASVRLVDNLQFQLSLTLKPRSQGWHALKSRLEKYYVTRLRGFDPTRMVAATIVYEGGSEEVARQEGAVKRLAGRHGGMRAGAANGQRGYALTFGIAYLRDFVMRHWVVAESFETSLPWSSVLPACEAVKRRIETEYLERGLPGLPFISCRVTQVYQTGVCVYFYLAFWHKGIEQPVEVFEDLERSARDEILRNGGSISHHHGVGKLRQAFLPRIQTTAALEWKSALKQSIDPTNVFGIANQGITTVPTARV
jgi:alkyldihydroxyacetonephosphate synthase